MPSDSVDINHCSCQLLVLILLFWFFYPEERYELNAFPIDTFYITTRLTRFLTCFQGHPFKLLALQVYDYCFIDDLTSDGNLCVVHSISIYMAAWICLHIKNERLLTVEDDMYINVLQLSWPIADSRSTVMFDTDALESSSQIELTAGLFT